MGTSVEKSVLYCSRNSKPFITGIFRSNSIQHNGETIYIAGSLEFHGIKKEIEIEAEIEDTEDLIKIYTTFKVKLSDFEIKRPSLYLKKIEDEIAVEINLTFSPS